MRTLKLTKETIQNILTDLLKRSPNNYTQYESSVNEIIANVRSNGDQAVFDYTQKFDGATVTADNIEVTEDEIAEAYELVDQKLLEVIRKAKENIRVYHEKQKQYSWFDSSIPGTMLGQKVTPIAKAGVYVPGGKAVYPSSVLMNIMPAKVAGVEEIIMTTPCNKAGKINPSTLVAAKEAGADRVFKVGGAQAIAALAFGTESIPKVDKIVGPGNIYVALAKKAVFGHVSIDSIAGPSEILVLADETANPRFVAADLLSQAEHDELASAILITTSEKLAEEVSKEVDGFCEVLSRKAIIEKSLENYGYILIAPDLDTAIDGESIIVKPEKELIIPIKKKNILSHFFSSSKRERSKMIVTALMSAMFLPYRKMKVQPNKVTFLSNRSDRLTGNIKSVFFEMTKLNNVDITVLCKKGGLKANLPNLFKFFKLYATSSVVFVDDYYHFLSYLKKKDDVKLIQLWHACGAFKTFGFSRLGRDSYLRQSSPNHRQYDYVIVSSNEVIPYYAEGFGVSMDKVIALGSPRCDVLEDENYKKRFKKRFYKENPEFKGKKILLFAPTFRGGGMGNCFYPIEKFEVDKIFDKISDDWVIAVKMHPYLSERPTCSAKYKDRLIDLTSKYDVNDLLFVSDLLITDYSSVIFEASIVNVPMLFFAFDLNEYSRDRDFYCNFASFVPGKIVLNTDEMTDSINNEDYNQELVKPFRQRYFGTKTGEATKNVVEFTKELLDNNV